MSVVLALFLALTPAWGAEPIKMGSLKSDEVNVRSGPGTRYPILWTYKLRGYPIHAFAEYDLWYKIRDAEGEEGWISKNFFSNIHTVLISPGPLANVYTKNDGNHVIMQLEPGVVATLDRCAISQCRVKIEKRAGWVNRDRLLMLDPQPHGKN